MFCFLLLRFLYCHHGFQLIKNCPQVIFSTKISKDLCMSAHKHTYCRPREKKMMVLWKVKGFYVASLALNGLKLISFSMNLVNRKLQIIVTSTWMDAASLGRLKNKSRYGPTTRILNALSYIFMYLTYNPCYNLSSL